MPQRAHLVCQHLEGISRQALEKHQSIIRRFVRRRQGIYALYRKGRLYYVGLASNLRSRLRVHLRNKPTWDSFSVYLTIGDTHLRELEALILRIVDPPGNKQKGKFPKSENMRGLLARDLKDFYLAELRNLFGNQLEDEEEVTVELDGRTPALAKYIDGPLKIRSRYKGKFIKARVRHDGRIRFGGKLYTSPSVAGAVAVKRRSCNGWTFWKYERAPGDWVMLNELRK